MIKLSEDTVDTVKVLVHIGIVIALFGRVSLNKYF